MRQIKLTGREQAVIRAIDYTTGSTGSEIQVRTQIDASDVADLLGSLSEVGYLEPTPYTERILFTNYGDLRFEVNPAYALDLKEALRRH